MENGRSGDDKQRIQFVWPYSQNCHIHSCYLYSMDRNQILSQFFHTCTGLYTMCSSNGTVSVKPRLSAIVCASGRNSKQERFQALLQRSTNWTYGSSTQQYKNNVPLNNRHGAAISRNSPSPSCIIDNHQVLSALHTPALQLLSAKSSLFVC